MSTIRRTVPSAQEVESSRGAPYVVLINGLPEGAHQLKMLPPSEK